LGQEGPLLDRLLSVLPSVPTHAEAVARVNAQGIPVRSILIAEDDCTAMFEKLNITVTLDDARKNMTAQGYVTMVEDVQILLAPLRAGWGLVSVVPSLAGEYFRTGDYLGVLVKTKGMVAVVPVDR
jgi:hypothetical protein